jgi:GntR family transcriptional regulator/MocR family aminotransferase
MARTRSNSSLADDLMVELVRTGPVPLHRQIEASLRGAIRAGRLRPGTSLPPSRVVAGDLGVSRGVVVEAYQQLVAEGYLTSRPGGYTQVASGAAPAPTRKAVVPAPSPPVLKIDFGYGRADVSHFPRAAWLRSLRTVLTEAPSDRFGYLSGHGMPELRVALADYLNRARGTAATPDSVVITNGYAQGITLVIRALAAAGARRIVVEDPSPDDDAQPLARAAGLDVVGVPVGAAGIRVDLLDRTPADAAVLTPSHQWPTGGVLSADARAGVLRWAARCGALVVEDDYDAEYRYDRAPVGAMQGLDPDRVIYAGTVSKTLAPGLRIGWLVLPRHLVDAVAAAKRLADRGSPALDQLAFADFLSRGEFDRHLRRMRPVYRARRDALLAALSTRTPELEVVGVAAGQHLVAWLPGDLDESTVVTTAAERGVGVYGVGPYRLDGSGRGGLIFGYATLSERAMDEGVAMLAEAIDAVRRSSR